MRSNHCVLILTNVIYSAGSVLKPYDKVARMIPMRVDMWVNIERVMFAGSPPEPDDDDDNDIVDPEM